MLRAILAACLVGVACAPRATPAAGVQRNLVTAEELAVVGDVNLHDALARLRPNFLRRTTTGVQTTPVTVYLDDIQMVEGVEHLRAIASKSVREVRYLEPQQANARFGGNNSGGALLITTKK